MKAGGQGEEHTVLDFTEARPSKCECRRKNFKAPDKRLYEGNSVYQRW
jgi:hypothetical protein